MLQETEEATKEMVRIELERLEVQKQDIEQVRVNIIAILAQKLNIPFVQFDHQLFLALG
jgi:hypothetical protein